MKPKKPTIKTNSTPNEIPPQVKKGSAQSCAGTPKFEIVGSDAGLENYSPCERAFYLSALHSARLAGHLERRCFATVELLRRNFSELMGSANKILKSAGFPKERASEIYQIARYCPDDSFEAWRKGEIGIRGVLKAARARKKSECLSGTTQAIQLSRGTLFRPYTDLSDQEKLWVGQIVEVYKNLAQPRPGKGGHQRTFHTVNHAIHDLMKDCNRPLSFKVAAHRLRRKSIVAARNEEIKIENKIKTRWDVACAKKFFGQWGPR